MYTDTDTRLLKSIGNWGRGWMDYEGTTGVGPPGVIVGIEADVYAFIPSFLFVYLTLFSSVADAKTGTPYVSGVFSFIIGILTIDDSGGPVPFKFVSGP